MFKVIAPRVGRESAAVLESYLNDPVVEENITLNWGNSGFHRHDPREVFGNKPEGVFRSSNKHVFFDLCKNLGTVPVVTEYSGPCFQHFDPGGHNGSGLKYVDSPEDFLPGVLTTQEVKGREFRVYFCYNMVPLIYEKVPLSSEVVEAPVHNSHNGYGYKKFNSTISGLKDILVDYTQKVARRIELSYGAVDFIMSEDHLVYILESNTAPTLFNTDLCEGFAAAIKENFNV
jgi:hypothetical protein